MAKEGVTDFTLYHFVTGPVPWFAISALRRAYTVVQPLWRIELIKQVAISVISGRPHFYTTSKACGHVMVKILA